MKIIEITETEESSETAQDLVGRVVPALVEHYRQKIHVVEADPPHFDPVTAHLPTTTIPVVIQHWVTRLEESNHSYESLMDGLLASYQTCIRPALFQSNKAIIEPSGVVVLIHYELLVSQFSMGKEQQQSPLIRDGSRSRSTVNASSSQTLQRLACDVTLVTSCLESEHTKGAGRGVSQYMISNVILSTLLRLQSLGLNMSTVASTSGSEDKDVGSTSDVILRRCAVSLLAFGVPRLGPREVDAAIADELSRVSRYLLSGSESATLKDDSNNKLDIRLHGMDWKAVELDGTAWDDPTVGVATRMANSLWQQLAVQLHNQSTSTGTGTNTSTIDTDIPSDCLNVAATKKLVLVTLGIESMAKDVRAHFFGRDMVEDATALTNRKSATRLHLGRTVSYSPPSNDPLNRPYQEIPSRVHVALQFISLLDIHTTTVNVSILDDLLPICYELLMASTDEIRALGAAALLHLLKCEATPTDLWSQTVDNLLPPLDHACKTCRLGPAVAVIGLAQTELFRQLSSSSNSTRQNHLAPFFARDRRRQATQHWLLVLHQNSVKMGDPLQWGLLMGAILPLLADHIAAENADAMELGRLGLTALLPLLQTEPALSSLWNNDDDNDNDDGDNQTRLLTSRVRHEIPLLALVALSQLLVAAHPIMPRHGGKIASALLACMGHHHLLQQEASGKQKDADTADTKSAGTDAGTSCSHQPKLALTAAVAQHVAVLALVVCGARARVVSEQVLDSKEEYDEEFVRLIEQVQQKATTLPADHET
jgi:hypothetical protein